jgi:5-methylcytosine-specific restriction protein A
MSGQDDNWYEITVDERQIKRERAKARELRASSWWKNIIAQGVCHYCQGKFPPAEISMDHVVPLARGGMSTKGNIVPACKQCNQSKKLKTPVEEILEKLRKEREERGED